MYKSRIKKTAGSLTVAVDSQNGELLSLVDESSGDNLIKNSSYTLPNPFALTIGGITLTAPSNTDIKKTPALQPEVREGASSITVVYPMLTDGVRFFDITVTVEIRCLPSSRLEFSIGVQNRSASRIDECRFPCVNGVFHGESYEDDTLVYPFNAGLKIRNPVAYLEKTPKKIYWRWQQYRYCYLVDGICTGANASGLYELNNLYSGPLSMPWIDYYSDNCGLYFGMNKTNGICSLSVSTFGKKSPGMNFSFVKKVETDGDFSMDGITLALHGGSWYEGADIYRGFAPAAGPPRSRGWFGESIAVCAHYDFKYQNGGVVHTFADIPLLADTASEQGGDHLLISGWHTDGFDNGFPDYRPDPDLGSPDDLCSALVRRMRVACLSLSISIRGCQPKIRTFADTARRGQRPSGPTVSLTTSYTATTRLRLIRCALQARFGSSICWMPSGISSNSVRTACISTSLRWRRRVSATTAGTDTGCMTGRRDTESCFRRPGSFKRKRDGR